MSAYISFASTSQQQYVRCEIRSVIRFCVAKGKTPIKIYRKLESVNGERVMSKDKV